MNEVQTASTEKKTVHRVGLGFAMILGLLALLYALFLNNELKRQIQTTDKALASLASGLSKASVAMQQSVLETQRQNARMAWLETKLNRLSELSDPVNKGVLVQAEYLAQLAQLNLNYEGDVQGAKALLEMIEKRLSSLPLSGVLTVRQAISTALTQLNAVEPVDLSGIVTKLNALGEQIEKMPLVPSLPKTEAILTAPKRDTKLDSVMTDWKDALSTSWDALQRVIIIRRHGQSIEPLLEPSQFLYLKQNILLQLQNAQWAALHRQQAVYADSLKRANTWVNHYFTDNSLDSRAIQRSLSDLQQMNVAPSLPDLSPVLSALNKLESASYGVPNAPSSSMVPTTKASTEVKSVAEVKS